VEAGSSGQEKQSLGYTPAFFVGAGLATLFFAPIALIAALIMLGGETNPAKRATLRSWAWFSGAWLVAGVVLLIVLASVTFGSSSHGGVDKSGPCVGGPTGEGRNVPGSTTKFVMPCEFGGTETVTIP
jgi:hypothetical protein